MNTYSPEDLSRIIEMAWEDRTPFEVIENLYGLNQHQLIELMRKELRKVFLNHDSNTLQAALQST